MTTHNIQPMLNTMIDDNNKWFDRARHGGRQRQFFTLPEQYDVNSGNDVIVNSVIAWSFYPKLLTREGKGWRNVGNNQTVVLHPTSVNKQSDARWLSYYSIMQARNRSRTYNAQETSAVDDFAIALLCGDSEFRVCGLFFFFFFFFLFILTRI